MVTFKQPTYGTEHDILTHTITKVLPDGDLRQARPSWWPTNDILLWKFNNLSYAQKEAFKTFVCENLGKEVRLVDELNRVWIGWIISPEIEITQTHKDSPECANSGLYALEFQFDGRLG